MNDISSAITFSGFMSGSVLMQAPWRVTFSTATGGITGTTGLGVSSLLSVVFGVNLPSAFGDVFLF